MKKLLVLIVLGMCACNREPREGATAPAQSALNEAAATQAAKSNAPLVLPMPKDQAELDRLILAGYTPHGEHLHPPGVKNCPLVKEGNEAVM